MATNELTPAGLSPKDWGGPVVCIGLDWTGVEGTGGDGTGLDRKGYCTHP